MYENYFLCKGKKLKSMQFLRAPKIELLDEALSHQIRIAFVRWGRKSLAPSVVDGRWNGCNKKFCPGRTHFWWPPLTDISPAVRSK